MIASRRLPPHLSAGHALGAVALPQIQGVGGTDDVPADLPNDALALNAGLARIESRDFFAAAIAAGKTAELIEPAHFGHLEMAESPGGPYGPNGRAVLRLMGLWPPR